MAVSDLSRKPWDVVIVGGGHNGLTCAAYLARAGKQVLVLEKRDRVGGACTIEEPWPGIRVSPCAYLAGLLHPLVVEELDLPALGFSWFPAINGLFLPFEDGTSVQLYEDDEQCEAEIARQDFSGWTLPACNNPVVTKTRCKGPSRSALRTLSAIESSSSSVK